MNESNISTSQEICRTIIASQLCVIIESNLCIMEDKNNVACLETIKEDALDVMIKG